MLFSFPITGHVKNKMSVLFLYPHKLYKKLLALSLYVGIKTNNIDILFFTWPVMGKQKNTVQFNVPGLFGCSGVFRSVPVFQCSSVPEFLGFSTERILDAWLLLSSVKNSYRCATPCRVNQPTECWTWAQKSCFSVQGIICWRLQSFGEGSIHVTGDFFSLWGNGRGGFLKGRSL